MSSSLSIDAPAPPSPAGLTDRFYESQALRLHYADWGNDAAPPLILIHGGRDHCRSWDAVARALQPHFHVMAPDLRGHGDSDWAKGSSYSLSDYVYDLACLVRSASVDQTAIVGHLMGGMIGLMYVGAYPNQVSHLAVLDGVTVLRGPPRRPIHKRITEWVSQLDKIAERKTAASAALPRQPNEFRRTISESHPNRRYTSPITASNGTPTAATVGNSTNIRGPWRRIGCPRMTMPHFGRASLALRYCCAGTKAFLPDPETAAFSHISDRPAW